MPEDNRAIRQYLQLLASAGITHLPGVTLPKPAARPGLKRTRPGATTRSETPATKRNPTVSTNLKPGSAERPAPFEQTETLLARQFQTAQEKADGLNSLAQIVAGCRRCTELAESRRQTVFGVGNPDAEIMFIGEAPGADEDRQGEPFVGAAGQLMNRIIDACGLKREDLYICNILRCRPPGNRTPQPQETANCQEFLTGQIRIVNPEYIVCWGTVAAQNLLGEDTGVGRLRGRFLQHGPAKVLCTYHPSYLLRNPAAKKQVWEDMKLLMKERGVEL